MKRFTSILAGLALVSTAQAADTVDLKWNAEMRTRYTSDNAWSGQKDDKTFGSNTYNSFGQRNKLGLRLTKGENFQGQVSLINHFFWGSTTNYTNSGFNPGPADKVAANGQDSNLLLVNEAYGWWKANDMLSLKFGRSAFEVAGGFVSSADDWLAVPYTWDGLWAVWDFEPVSVTAFGIKAKDGNVSHTQLGTAHVGQSDPEAIMYGAAVGVKTLPDFFKKAEIHLIQHSDELNAATTGTTANTPYRSDLLRYGFILSGDMSGFDYRAVADMYSGKYKVFGNNTSTDYDVTGSMFDIGFGYTLTEVMMLHFGFDYHMDSGGEAANSTNKAFKSYMPGQYDKHNVGGTYLDAVTWGNLTYFQLSAGIKPMDDFGADLRYTKFQRSNDQDYVTVYGFNAGKITGGDRSNDIGSEIDLTLTKSYGDNLSLWALYGVFTPGDLVKKDGTNGTVGSTEEDSHTRIQLQGKLTF